MNVRCRRRSQPALRLSKQLQTLDPKSKELACARYVSEQVDFAELPRRLPGRRVKRRMKRDRIQTYNREGSVRRVETG
jgi:hypothetical protein